MLYWFFRKRFLNRTMPENNTIEIPKIKVVRWIIIHHSACEDSSLSDAQKIREIHTVERGWADVGYHYLVEEIHDALEAVVGRPLHLRGAHCLGQNHNSIGICLIGNYEEVSPPEEALKIMARRVIVPLLEIFKLDASAVQPHNKFGDTLCPGKFFSMDKLRSYL